MSLPIRVLVVEDSSFLRRALSRRIELDPRFCVIDTAEDGQQGVEKAIRLKPDIITLDVEMPVLNGLDALKIIVERTSIPVVMLSAVTEDGAEATLKALSLGAIDFIPKAKGVELIHETLFAAAQARSRKRQPPARQGQDSVIDVPKRKPLPFHAFSPVSFPQARIVVIGSSTGGPQALHQVLKQLPGSFRLPVVIAQHMPPQFTAALAKSLDASCAVAVTEARNGDRLQGGHVYIAPGGMQMRVEEAKYISIAASKGESLYKPSVSVLARSAIEHYGPQAIGVMLTGMGNDGSQEFVEWKQAGAYVLAQDQASSVVYGMPRAVVEGGGASEVMPLDRIGERLASLAQ